MTQFANLSTLTNNSWSSYLNGSIDELNWNYSLFDKEFGLPLNTDPFPADLFPSPDELFPSRSIHDDIKQIESSGSVSPSDTSVASEIDYELPKIEQIEIRNIDCMWSGAPSSQNTVSSIAKTTNQQQSQKPSSKIKQEIIEDENSQNNCNNSNINSNTSNRDKMPTMKNVPPGTSLLINSRLKNRSNQQQQQQQQQNVMTTKIPSIGTPIFLKDRDPLPSFAPRPDTPLSLDDDVPEFKHTVDLAACIMGSNNIPLEEEKTIINKIREKLEDTTTQQIDMRKILPVTKQRNGSSLTEVLNVIDSIENESLSISNSNINLIKMESNYSSTETETEDEDSSDGSSSNSRLSTSILYSQQQQQQQQHQYSQPQMNIHHSDHSYTRSKEGCIDVVAMGLETPSDSDEEIDVVSIGDKKLPTNPSDRDRRMLQSKISARIVKTPAGLRTIPPRRRVSYGDPYSQTSSGIISPCNSGSKSTSVLSRYPTPAATPHPYNNTTNTTGAIKYSNSAGRKRQSTTTTPVSNKEEYQQQSKRQRQQQHTIVKPLKQQQILPIIKTTPVKRHYDADTETIEKRNLHNDMERQRRIGLKNLFEALKKQIPTIKDKERAPKVNILREAAKLCDQVTREEKLLQQQRIQLMQQLQKREQLLQRSKKQQQMYY